MKSLIAAMTRALQNINTPLRRKHPNMSGKAKLQPRQLILRKSMILLPQETSLKW
jgi:hypothetical protein